MTPKISVLIPTRGDLHLLERSLPVLLATRDLELEVVVISNDPERPVAERMAAVAGDRARVLETGFDAGFCRAINLGYRESNGEFIFLSNPDLFVTPDYLPRLVGLLQRRERAALASGKVLRYDVAARTPTRTIDTAGLSIARNRRIRDRGEGLPDNGDFDGEREVFGVSGAALVARRSALEEALLDGELLDTSFWMYKDDSDLSWRLRLLGWQCWYASDAIAYHGRTSRGGGSNYLRNAGAFLRAERAKPAHVRVHSMKNQWLMLVKNEDWYNLRRDFPHILAREALVFGYNLVLAPRTFIAFRYFLRELPATLTKRRELKRRQVVEPPEVRHWFE